MTAGNNSHTFAGATHRPLRHPEPEASPRDIEREQRDSERLKHLRLLECSAAEIRQLRQLNEVLQAKVSTMELLGNLGRSQSRDYGGGSVSAPDVVWEIDRVLEHAREQARGVNVVEGEVA